MEQATNALKTSSKVISIIMKIGYIAMIVAMCICVTSLIFVAATGGKTSLDTAAGTHIIIADGTSASPSGVMTQSIVYFVMSGCLFAIFLLAHRMFREISATGDPFLPQYGKTVRVLGVLVAATTIAVGLADIIASAAMSSPSAVTFTEAPGIVVGAIIFCLSYIIDYGCVLKQQADKPQL